MAESDAALRAATAALEHALPQAVKGTPGLDAAALARTVVGAWMAALHDVPGDAAAGTAVDWDPEWPAPPGWRIEVYPTSSPDRTTSRHDRMHAAARLIKE